MLEPDMHPMEPQGYHYMELIVSNENIVGSTTEGAKYKVTNSTLAPNVIRGVGSEITGDYT